MTPAEVAAFLGKNVLMINGACEMQGRLVRLDYDDTIVPRFWAMVDYGYAMDITQPNFTIEETE